MSGEGMRVEEPSARYLAKAEALEVPSGCKRTEVGIIPAQWDARPLRDNVSLLSGHHVLAEQCNSEGVGTPYLTGPADFPNGRIEQTKYTANPSTLCAAGDILVTVKGSGAGTLIEANAEYCISRQLMAIRTSGWSERFLFYSLAQNSSRIRAASTGLIPGLSRSDILDQKLPIPSDPAEQRAIAEALSDVDGSLGALEALIAKKRAIKQAAMQQLLTGNTRLPGFRGEWEQKPFSSILDRINPKGFQIQTSDYQTVGRYPVVDQGKDLVVGHSDREDRRFRCPDGGVIVFGDHTCITKFIYFDFVLGADGTQIIQAKNDRSTRFYACLLYTSPSPRD